VLFYRTEHAVNFCPHSV
jgi:hypothetical protein